MENFVEMSESGESFSDDDDDNAKDDAAVTAWQLKEM